MSTSRLSKFTENQLDKVRDCMVKSVEGEERNTLLPVLEGSVFLIIQGVPKKPAARTFLVTLITILYQ